MMEQWQKGDRAPGHCPPTCSQVRTFPPLHRIREPSASAAPAESQVWTGLALACGEDTKRLSHHKTAVSSTSSEPAASRSPLVATGWRRLAKGADLEPRASQRASSLRLEISRQDDYCLARARFQADSVHRSAKGEEK